MAKSGFGAVVLVLLQLGSAVTVALSPGAKVLVVGNGGAQCLAARLAAISGYQTTFASIDATAADDEKVMFDATYPKESLPLSILPVTGPSADEATITECLSEIEGLIIAFDSERTLPESSMNIFMGEGKKLSHVSLMSRSLNGKGMGPFPTAAKFAANPDVWAGGDAVEKYKEMEARVQARAAAIGATCTVIRAGTLKGGGCGDANEDAGEPMFLNPYFYSLGQQDVVNWRLLYDCETLGVELTAGDTMPGPGFTAALTAIDRLGDGDSHRGAVAMALVQALGCETAVGKDFSVAAKKGRKFAQPAEWPAMFAAAK